MNFREDLFLYNCLQTNIQNNNNKYYLVQLLEGDGENQYWVWMRWGRVGFNGQNSLTPCGANVSSAKSIFEKKFSDKTKNDWCDKDDFVKVQGKYDLVHMDYEAGGDDEVDGSKNGGKGKKSQKEQPEEKVEIKESKLHSKLQELIRDELYRNRSSRKIDYQILQWSAVRVTPSGNPLDLNFSRTVAGITK